MIIIGIVMAVLLVVAAGLFVVPLTRQVQLMTALPRDEVNKAYYQHRLRELEEDAQQGIIGDQQELVNELQHNLLVDIPVQKQQQTADQPVNGMVIFIGLVVLIAVTLFSYFKTGNWAQVSHLQQIEARFPQLQTKYQLNQLTVAEVQDYALGLRSKMQPGRENINDLLVLGEMGLRLNNYTMASQAFAHAYQRAPYDPMVQGMYGYITLMYAQNDNEVNFALSLLKQSLQHNPDNLFVIKALAFYSLESKDNDMMLYYWQLWFDKLPEDSPSRAMVANTLEHIKKTILAGEQP